MINTGDSLFSDADELVSGLWKSRFISSPPPNQGFVISKVVLRCIGIVCLFFGGQGLV